MPFGRYSSENYPYSFDFEPDRLNLIRAVYSCENVRSLNHHGWKSFILGMIRD